MVRLLLDGPAAGLRKPRMPEEGAGRSVGHWYAEESIAVPGPGIDTRPISAASSTTG